MTHVPYVVSLALLVIVAGVLWAKEEAKTPPELGDVMWERDFEKAVAASKETGKPLLVLFQEVPG